ncbi:MAG: hypothetical protein JSW71_02340 [Gemmatimonadota bacterium]|nr:MAG: hypothetical protein JSW71_02340 [Gemmatimonadota bacterium]
MTVTLLRRMSRVGATAASVVLAMYACGENIVAPAICPEYCPAAELVVIDSIMPGSVENDSSYSGHVQPHQAKQMQIALDDTVVSNGVLRFEEFEEEIVLGSSGLSGLVVAVDSFRLELLLSRRSEASELTEIAVHRLPAGFDSTTTYADLEPYFGDTTLVATLELPDTVIGGTVSAILPGDALPAVVEDSLAASVGLAYRSPQAGFADIVASDSTSLASILIRYAQVDSIGVDTVPGTDTVLVEFDTFLFSSSQAADVNTLTVGGSPSTRALIRTNIPTQIVDSSSVVRATLILVPSEPVRGVAGDTLVIVVDGLSTDVGAKSPIIPLPSEVGGLGIVEVPAGWSDTVRIEVTHLLRAWRASPSLPRALSLRAVPEGVSLSQARFRSSRSVVGVPSLHVSYVPPVILQSGGGQ